MAVAFAPLPKNNPIATLPARESTSSNIEDIFSVPPVWGGSWRAFFRMFEGQRGGLSRTEIATGIVGDEQIVSSEFQYVIIKAIEAGLLVSINKASNVIVVEDGHEVYRTINREKLFLNDHSERVKTLLEKVPSIPEEEKDLLITKETIDPLVLKAGIDKFCDLDFEKLAQQAGQQITDNYANRFLSFLSSQRFVKTLYMQDFYKQNQLYPDIETCYDSRNMEFLDVVVACATEFGLLRSKLEPSGRQVFSVEDGLHELIFKGCF